MKRKICRIICSLLAFMAAIASTVDIAVACMFLWGEPEFPNESDFE